MVHISQLHVMLYRGEFTIAFVSRSGELIDAGPCVITSWHSAGSTFNMKIVSSGEIRKVNRLSVVRVNDKEVYL